MLMFDFRPFRVAGHAVAPEAVERVGGPTARAATVAVPQQNPPPVDSGLPLCYDSPAILAAPATIHLNLTRFSSIQMQFP